MAGEAMTDETVRLGEKLFWVKGRVLYFTGMRPEWRDTELVVSAIDAAGAKAKYEAWYTNKDRDGSQAAEARSATELHAVVDGTLTISIHHQ
jgi:hypothetical protein